MPSTDVSENLQLHVSIFNTAQKALIFGAGIVLVLLFYDRNKRETLYKALVWLRIMGNSDSTKKEGSKQKLGVFWFDRRNSERTIRFFETLKKNLENVQPLYDYDFIPVNCNDTHTITKGKNKPIVALCLVTTDRFSSDLDFGLEGLEGTDYDRTLVIMIHQADKGEVTVSTKMKAALTDKYKDLKNVIDVRFGRSQEGYKTRFDRRYKIEGCHEQNVEKEVLDFLKKFQPVSERNADDIQKSASEKIS